MLLDHVLVGVFTYEGASLPSLLSSLRLSISFQWTVSSSKIDLVSQVSRMRRGE